MTMNTRCLYEIKRGLECSHISGGHTQHQQHKKNVGLLVPLAFPKAQDTCTTMFRRKPMRNTRVQRVGGLPALHPTPPWRERVKPCQTLNSITFISANRVNTGIEPKKAVVILTDTSNTQHKNIPPLPVYVCDLLRFGIISTPLSPSVSTPAHATPQGFCGPCPLR